MAQFNCRIIRKSGSSLEKQSLLYAVPQIIGGGINCGQIIKT